MSKSNENTNLTVAASAPEENPTVEKQSLVKRGVNFVKSHKKAALAVAGLVVLVGVSAALGKDSDSTEESIYRELEMEDGPVIEIKDEDGNVTDMI